MFLKTEASALPKFGGKYGLVRVRGKRRHLEVFDKPLAFKASSGSRR